ncbi:hypothetical protein [Rothia sp. 88186D007BW]
MRENILRPQNLNEIFTFQNKLKINYSNSSATSDLDGGNIIEITIKEPTKCIRNNAECEYPCSLFNEINPNDPQRVTRVIHIHEINNLAAFYSSEEIRKKYLRQGYMKAALCDLIIYMLERSEESSEIIEIRLINRAKGFNTNGELTPISAYSNIFNLTDPAASENLYMISTPETRTYDIEYYRELLSSTQVKLEN